MIAGPQPYWGVRSKESEPVQPYGHRERSLQLAEANRPKTADVMSEHSLWEAHQLIAVDARFLFQTLFEPDGDLRTETIMPGVNRCAYHGREARINQSLPAHDDKNTLFARVSAAGLPY